MYQIIVYGICISNLNKDKVQEEVVFFPTLVILVIHLPFLETMLIIIKIPIPKDKDFSVIIYSVIITLLPLKIRVLPYSAITKMVIAPYSELIRVILQLIVSVVVYLVIQMLQIHPLEISRTIMLMIVINLKKVIQVFYLGHKIIILIPKASKILKQKKIKKAFLYLILVIK